ncbi:MAG: hypothetical protein RLZZ232_3382, partial [Planctomycetota bacterium]
MLTQRFQRIHDGKTPWQRCDTGHTVRHRSGTDASFVSPSSLASRSVEDQLDFPIRHVVQQVWSA